MMQNEDRPLVGVETTERPLDDVDLRNSHVEGARSARQVETRRHLVHRDFADTDATPRP